MKNKSFNRYYLPACIGVLIASYYPLSMGIRVITDMIVDGAVLKENYPKYIISVVLIITILNCLYGFGQMIKSGEKKRLKSLILQSVCSLTFLGLCILACFTAFWRDGSIQVSPLSATLMAVFFILLGVTAGVFVGSFLLEKRKLVSIWIPSIVASAMTFLMYIGEMFLLNGHLYSFGSGIIFDSLPVIVFAPIDLIIILAAGGITALIFTLLNSSKHWRCGWFRWDL